jgi:hypothetical protein
MAVTTKWLQHIEAWQLSSLSQAEYCAQRQINARTFAARLRDYRKLPEAASATLIPVCVLSGKRWLALSSPMPKVIA